MPVSILVASTASMALSSVQPLGKVRPMKDAIFLRQSFNLRSGMHLGCPLKYG